MLLNPLRNRETILLSKKCMSYNHRQRHHHNDNILFYRFISSCCLAAVRSPRRFTFQWVFLNLIFFLSPFHPQLPLVVIILDSVVKLPRNLVKKICFWYNQFRSLTNLASINNNNRNLTATTWAMMPMKPSSLPVMQHRKDSVLMPSVSTTTPHSLSLSLPP